MAILLVDTDVYSYLTSTNPSRGAPYRPHLQGHVIALSFITVGEQYAGYRRKIRKGDWAESQMQKLELRLTSVVIVPYEIGVCRTYGNLKSTITNPDGGDRAIAPNDLWIAACAVRHSLTLVTNNRRHFQNIPGLIVISEAPL